MNGKRRLTGERGMRKGKEYFKSKRGLTSVALLVFYRRTARDKDQIKQVPMQLRA